MSSDCAPTLLSMLPDMSTINKRDRGIRYRDGLNGSFRATKRYGFCLGRLR